MTEISVIIPVHNSAGTLYQSLTSATRAIKPTDEIIVVADGTIEADITVANNFDVQVLPLPQKSGPAKARNCGAVIARSDILFFIDSDVVIPVDAVEKIRTIFDQNLDLAAVIGSYDDAPAEKNFLSQYRNLLHHYVHQNSSTWATTFWGACGAIRREVFFAQSGFDEGFTLPSIEDIELGYRLTASNYQIRLDKTLQVKHLKRWDPLTLIKTDIFLRALPWAKLIVAQDRLINDLNLTATGRLSSFLVGSGALFLVLSPRWKLFRISAISCMILLAVLNRNFYKFLNEIHGPWFMIQAVLWHWLYYLYGGLAYLWVYLTSGQLQPKRIKK